MYAGTSQGVIMSVSSQQQLIGDSYMYTYKEAIEFFLPVTIVIIPDVLVTNLITKL